MSTTIICPNCNHQFEPTEALAQTIRETMRKEFNQRYQEEMREKEKKFATRESQILQQQEQVQKAQEQLQAQMRMQEQEMAKKLDEHKKTLESEISLQLTQKIKSDYENELVMLKDANKTNEAKLTEARQKELEFLKQMQTLQTREAELELEIQRKLAD